MMRRQITSLACATVAVVAATGAAVPAAGPTTHRVQPGQSIQQVVDAAKPGDTVVLSAGTYRESVRVTTSRLTLRGMGPATVLKPGPEGTGNACARAGNGICVEGTDDDPVTGTTIRSLTLSGFARDGLLATRTDKLTVRRTTVEENGQRGIAIERSLRSVVRHNTARANGDAGVFLANATDEEAGATDTRGTVVEHNILQDNRIGTIVRRLRNLTVEHNVITGNCAALFVVGDENEPRAGNLTVSGNIVHRNNKYCPATERLPFMQGVGIVLTGAEDTLVTRNQVTDNQGTSPMSGGIVLYRNFVGALSEDNTVSRNIVTGNAPEDLINVATGEGNTFQSNSCGLSRPAGMC
ncbi:MULTISPECIES: right-handed parallel beta-helix repeat-containing protein [unclassified Streptomyces]|uniref:right-handed parallel beta-helix repeat-containing protein n=1 Tax=unclassified Streptomyces TaxID=2593676 RepID=UPI001908F2CA|nr:right-handed parallel beta-helix repeat-containing protein [Streptomyces sp. HSG2]